MVLLNDTKKGKLSNNPFVQGVIKEKKYIYNKKETYWEGGAYLSQG